MIISEAQIEAVSTELEEKWVDRPIKDELDLPVPDRLSAAAPGEITTDEESELPGQKRPAKGSGWWGTGPPLRPLRKA